MTSKLMFDTNIIARICHPTQGGEVQTWFRTILARGADAPEMLVSVLADYELRRKLLAIQATESLQLLDEIARSLRYVPVTADAARRAAEIRQLLGEAVASGLSDADLLMVAQAQAEGAILVTNDQAIHRIPGIVAKDWREIDPA